MYCVSVGETNAFASSSKLKSISVSLRSFAIEDTGRGTLEKAEKAG